MFPNPDQRGHNRWMAGKVFSLYITNAGLMEQGREHKVDREQWDRCQSCPSYNACRDLCFGSLLMRLAFQST
jgi:hypothetical protein